MTPRILILDGGLGTSLEQKYNVKFTHATPLWSSHLLVSDQDTLLHCQKDFGDVPVDIILTATYQVSIHGFANTVTGAFPEGISGSHVSGFIDAGVKVAEEATQKDGAVALSIGPYGACMIPSQEYSGNYGAEYHSGEALQAWHEERMKLFASIPNLKSRLGYLSLETIPRLDEIKAMRRALDSVPELAAVPFWMSCLFPGNDDVLPDGHSVKDAIEAMLDPLVAKATPFGIGINCTKVWKLNSLLRRYEASITSMLQQGKLKEWPALVLYPDGTNGEVYNTATQAWEMPDDANLGGDRVPWERQLMDVVKETGERGPWREIIVGGCCMASSDDIKRLRQLSVTQ